MQIVLVVTLKNTKIYQPEELSPWNISPLMEVFFLAFANYESDTAEKYNTDSFIYKFNDLTGKFFLYQTIGTHGGHDVEYFTISGEHYLAVANVDNGTTKRLNSVIYRWNGTSFFAFQNIATKGAASFNFLQ